LSKLLRARKQSYLEAYTWTFAGISYFSDLRQTRCVGMIPKPGLETKLITKETTYTLDFGKHIFVSFRRFIEDYLRNLTCWDKTKYGFGINSRKSMKKVEFRSRKKSSWVVKLQLHSN
jgi:hypothetical protein